LLRGLGGKELVLLVSGVRGSKKATVKREKIKDQKKQAKAPRPGKFVGVQVLTRPQPVLIRGRGRLPKRSMPWLTQLNQQR